MRKKDTELRISKLWRFPLTSSSGIGIQIVAQEKTRAEDVEAKSKLNFDQSNEEIYDTKEEDRP